MRFSVIVLLAILSGCQQAKVTAPLTYSTSLAL